jgi:hypothetical protein
MSNSVMHPSRGTVRICYAERDARKEVSIFVTLAPDLTEPPLEHDRHTQDWLGQSRGRPRLPDYDRCGECHQSDQEDRLVRQSPAPSPAVRWALRTRRIQQPRSQTVTAHGFV